MFRALLFKDFKLMLFPGLVFLGIWIFLTLLGSEWVLTGGIDLSLGNEYDEEPGAIGLLFSILVALLAPAIIHQEKDARTLPFLDQLPVARWQQFLSRCLSLVIWIALSLSFHWAITFSWLIFGSLEGPHLSAWEYCLSNWVSNLYFAVFFLAIAVALSLMRGMYAWLMFALIFYLFVQWMMYSDMDAESRSEAEFTHLFRASDVLFIEGEPSWGWKSMLSLLLCGGVSFAVALVGYQQLNRPFHQLWLTKAVSLLDKWWAKCLIVGVVMCVLIAFLNLSRDNYKERSAENKEKERLEDTSLKVKENEYFIWMIQGRDQKTFEKLIEKSEGIYENLLKDFAVESFPLDQKITVVPADRMIEYAAGTAHWKRIRLSRKVKGKQLEQTFRHELVHVFLEIWADGGLKENFKEAAIFHEGVAELFEGASRKEQRTKLKQAMVQAHWDPVAFSSLFAASELKRERGFKMIYPLGLLFAQSIVDCRDKNVLVQVAKAFVELKDSDLSGEPLWQEAFAQSNLSIEQVRLRFSMRIKKLREKHEAFLNKLPKPEAKLIKVEDQYFLKPLVVCELEEALMVADIDISAAYSKVMKENDERLIPVPKKFIERDSLELTLGWQIKGKKGHERYWDTLERVSLEEE